MVRFHCGGCNREVSRWEDHAGTCQQRRYLCSSCGEIVNDMDFDGHRRRGDCTGITTYRPPQRLSSSSESSLSSSSASSRPPLAVYPRRYQDQSSQDTRSRSPSPPSPVSRSRSRSRSRSKSPSPSPPRKSRTESDRYDPSSSVSSSSSRPSEYRGGGGGIGAGDTRSFGYSTDGRGRGRGRGGYLGMNGGGRGRGRGSGSSDSRIPYSSSSAAAYNPNYPAYRTYKPDEPRPSSPPRISSTTSSSYAPPSTFGSASSTTASPQPASPKITYDHEAGLAIVVDISGNMATHLPGALRLLYMQMEELPRSHTYLTLILANSDVIELANRTPLSQLIAFPGTNGRITTPAKSGLVSLKNRLFTAGGSKSALWRAVRQAEESLHSIQETELKRRVLCIITYGPPDAEIADHPDLVPLLTRLRQCETSIIHITPSGTSEPAYRGICEHTGGLYKVMSGLHDGVPSCKGVGNALTEIASRLATLPPLTFGTAPTPAHRPEIVKNPLPPPTPLTPIPTSTPPPKNSAALTPAPRKTILPPMSGQSLPSGAFKKTKEMPIPTPKRPRRPAQVLQDDDEDEDRLRNTTPLKKQQVKAPAQLQAPLLPPQVTEDTKDRQGEDEEEVIEFVEDEDDDNGDGAGEGDKSPTLTDLDAIDVGEGDGDEGW